MLALSALPAVDAMRRKQAATLSLLGAAVLLVAFLTWTELLQVNLRPWRHAAEMAATEGECPFEIGTTTAGKGASNFFIARDGIAGLEFVPPETVVAKTDQWTILTAGAGFVEPHKDFLRIFPGSKGVTVLLPANQINIEKRARSMIDIRPASGSGEISRKQVHLLLQARPGNAGLRVDPGDAIVDFYGLQMDSLSAP